MSLILHDQHLPRNLIEIVPGYFELKRMQGEEYLIQKSQSLDASVIKARLEEIQQNEGLSNC